MGRVAAPARSTPTTKGWTERIVGMLFASITIANDYDDERVESGLLDPAGVRRVELREVLVDTGASDLCLPADLIRTLGLRRLRTIDVQTAGGVHQSELFRGALLSIEDRVGVFNCIALPEGTQPLLGCTVMESLGVIPDVANHRLEFLPERGVGTHFTAYRA